jgi:hypothetical protein
MQLNPDNIAQHLVVFGYQAKAGTMTDKKTGHAQNVVFINGLGSINAYLNLSDESDRFGLKVFGNLQSGYAPSPSTRMARSYARLSSRTVSPLPAPNAALPSMPNLSIARTMKSA